MKTWAAILALSIGILTATLESAHAKPHLLNPMGERCAPLRAALGVDFNHVKPELKEWVVSSAKNLHRFFSRMLLIVQDDDSPALREFGLCYTIILEGEIGNALSLGSMGIGFGVKLLFDITQKLPAEIAPVAVYLTAAHELGHVFQSLVVRDLDWYTPRSVEHQADCLSGVIGGLTLDMDSRQNIMKATRAYFEAFQRDSVAVSAAQDHGTRAERIAATQFGLEVADRILSDVYKSGGTTVEKLVEACAAEYPLKRER